MGNNKLLSMLEKIKNKIEEEKLFSKEESLLLGVSGGVDSMCLAFCIHALGYSFSVAHINYQLRGEDSDKDEKWVADWCKSHNIPFFLKKVYHNPKESIQTWARNVRYEWFDDLIKTYHFNKLVLAHNLDDSFETVLYNLTKGTGILGLSGISLSTGGIVRPFIFISREEILNFAKKHSIKWREDASNKELYYNRNKIRHQVIPVLKNINPSVVSTYSDTYLRIQDCKEIVLQRVEEIQKKYLKKHNEGYFIKLDFLLKVKGARSILFEMLRPFEISFEGIKKISALKMNTLYKNKKYTFNRVQKGLWIVKNRDTTPSVIINEYGIYKWLFYKIVVEKWDTKNPLPTTKTKVVLNVNLNQHPLRVRSWQKGDTFRPKGMKGTKKVSDFLIDSKIPVSIKKMIPIFEVNNQICWIAGHRMDERFNFKENNENVLVKIMKK